MPLKSELTKFSTASPILANYSYTDIAEGTGVQKFYLFSSENNATKDYHLSSSVFYSRDTVRQATTANLDDDYDLSPFNLPKTIKGTAVIILPYSIETSVGPGTMYVICKIRKWDGTTETEIASAQSDTITCPDNEGVSGIWNFPITVPETLFAAGETLRLTVELYITAGHADNRYAYGIDPKNRATTLAPAAAFVATDGNILIPFKLDL